MNIPVQVSVSHLTVFASGLKLLFSEVVQWLLWRSLGFSLVRVLYVIVTANAFFPALFINPRWFSILDSGPVSYLSWPFHPRPPSPMTVFVLLTLPDPVLSKCGWYYGWWWKWSGDDNSFISCKQNLGNELEVRKIPGSSTNEIFLIWLIMIANWALNLNPYCSHRHCSTKSMLDTWWSLTYV